MSPFVVAAIAGGLFLLWYAFTGNSPRELFASIIPAASGTKKAKEK